MPAEPHMLARMLARMLAHMLAHMLTAALRHNGLRCATAG